ncbi:nuclease-related domain-containing protein [Pseudobacillus sp. 179-B 2D1 NHS]|uniref:nuclease-related domain-containing protein n=2 Tax=Bacillaceae TaxID=186817 RepID=UPI003879D980
MCDQFFQIYTLLLAPGYLLIMEMKNIAGTIVFEEQFQQMIRIMEGKEERFLNPVLQTARQRVLLQEWFAQYKQPSLKIHTITVFTNKKAIIKSFKHNLQVIQLGQLPSFLSSLDEKFASKTLTNRDQRTLSSFFVQQHVPLEIDILQRFQLKEEDLIKGISCPQCYKFSMVRHLRKWHCPACLFSTRDAHVRALQEYFLLLHSTITNRQLREFFQVPCPWLAHYLLSSMNLISESKNKGRRYMLNFNS